MNIKFFSLITIIVAVGCKNIDSEIQKETSQNKEIDSIKIVMDANVTPFLKDSSVTSISIGIYKNGKESIAHYGEMDPGKGNLPTNATLYEIASVTKTLTGTVAAQAVLDGKLNLDDDIRKYLKRKYKNLEYNGHPILIKHVLTHTSRLPSNNEGVDELFKNRDDSLFIKFNEIEKKQTKEKFYNYLQKITLDTIPGTKYRYSNVGANLMAHILETVYEKSFISLLNEIVLDKAGMINTKMNLSEEESSVLVNGYDDQDNLMPHLPLGNTLWGADGGLKSTMPDLVKYIKFQLESNDPAVNESRKKLYQEDPTEWIGYFWRIDENDEGIYYHHHGGSFGMNTYFFVYPEYDLGIAASTNSGGAKASSVLREVVDGLLDDLKPFGKKSIMRAISAKCYEDIDAGIQYYYQLKAENIDTYNFSDENELNRLGYKFLRQGKIKEAIKIFTLLVKEFPEASNPYDSLGEAYFENKNFELSLINYKKSLTLNPQNENALMMINKINELQEVK